MILWFSIGVPALYLSTGAVMAGAVQNVFTDSMKWRDWAWVTCCWPGAFFPNNWMK